MPISERAKQFMPFDALRGLRDALKLKEYKHEKIQMGDLSEETIQEISDTLSTLKKGDIVEVDAFIDGYIKTFSGISKLKFDSNEIIIDNKSIDLNNIIKIKKLN